MNLQRKSFLKNWIAGVALLAGSQAMADVMNPVIGNLLFEEQFNSLNSATWNVIEGDGCAIGLCGWGNQELEYYRAANVAIENVPFEPATRALAIQVRREAFGGKGFTSGKLDSANKVQVQYGMIELRISTPAVGVGLWPAAWMLGTSLAGWPSKGELDIMEMGHRAAGRAEAGYGGADINSYVGANAIFYSPSACVPENPTCAASTAWQTANAYVAQTPLVNRFVLYRMYWTESQIRFTVVDNGVERDMYRNPIPITADSSEFQAPFYFLLNLAVGGNFTDAATDAQVTAPMPAKMYVDYIRVYQIDGKGEVKLGNQVRTEAGTYGVYTDNTPTSNKEVLGTTADFWIWNTASMSAIATTPFEGANVIGLRYTTPGQWFGGGIASRQAHDMSKFANGVVKFRIRVPANVAFRIGVSDTYTNSNWVTFPANQTTYGLVRNGNWAQATIPVADLRGPLVALQSMASMFQFVNVDGQLPTAGFDMAIDDIVWECGTSAACQPASSSSSSVSSSRSSVSSVSSSSVPSNVLLSTGRPMTASSNLQPAGNAVDGNAATRWESTHGVSPSWLTVDLGTVKALSQVVIDWEAANAANYTIQGSNDNSNWTTLKTITGGTFGNRTDTHAVSGNYRYVRIYCTQRSVGNNWGYSIFELKVYGSNVASSSSSSSSVANGPLNVVAATASTQIMPAANAIDKNAGTRWESAHAVDPSWLSLDLGSLRTVTSLAIDWEAANAANYLIQCSSNNTSWTTIATRTGGTFGNRTDTVALNNSCRYVRIYGQTRSVGNQWGYSIWEVRVTGR